MEILWAIRKSGKGGEGIDPLDSGGIDSPPAIDRGEVRERTESRHVAAPRNDVSEPPEIADMGVETPADKTAVDGRSSMAKSLAESVVGGADDFR